MNNNARKGGTYWKGCLNKVVTATSVVAALTLLAACGKASNFSEQRRFLVEHHLVPQGITDTLVIKAMLTVKREEFVPRPLRHLAYKNRPLPIGKGQTISQPFIVAYMTQAMKLTRNDRVLEIGTGSGYHAAVMAEIAKEVYTIEILKPLAEAARKRLKKLGYKNVYVKHGDGYLGWPERAPFDKIILTASPPQIPTPLIKQLKEGGILVSPLDTPHGQILMRGIKKNGKLVTEKLLDVIFVPMQGKIREKKPTKDQSP